MAKLVFSDTHSGCFIEAFSVSQTFWDIVEVLKNDYPGVFDTFIFYTNETNNQERHIIECERKFPDEIKLNDKNYILHAINEAKFFLEGEDVKNIFKVSNSIYGNGKEKQITCSRIKKVINDLLSVLTNEPKYTKRYRLSGNNGNSQFSARSWNGIFVNGKRVYLQGGTGKCSMSVYNENNDGYSEIIDISSIKSLETSEGIIKIVSTKIRLPEINSLNSVLSKLDVYKDDAVISFGIRWE